MIGIEVKDQTFTVHEDIIKEKSEYFRKAFNEQWAEGKSRVIKMVDDEPEVIGDFVDWLYGSKMIVSVDNDNCDLEDRMAVYSCQYDQLAKLYIFGEKIQDNRLCNDVVSAIIDLINQSTEGFDDTNLPLAIYPVFPSVVAKIYGGTPQGSPARTFLADCAVLQGKDVELDPDIPLEFEFHGPEAWPTEYVYDVANAALKDSRKVIWNGEIQKKRGVSGRFRKHFERQAEWFKT